MAAFIDQSRKTGLYRIGLNEEIIVTNITLNELKALKYVIDKTIEEDDD